VSFARGGPTGLSIVSSIAVIRFSAGVAVTLGWVPTQQDYCGHPGRVRGSGSG
jgi:hypothetical protein